MSDWEKVGEIGVDAGRCWIGDACYILHNQKPYKSLGGTWEEFCDLLHADEIPHKQFSYDHGEPGLGLCVETGYGDGLYPVFVKLNSEGRVAEAKVVFIDPNEEEISL